MTNSKPNKLQILRILLENRELTAPDIVRITNLSRPTVDTFLLELIKEGIVRKKGTGISSGGRRPFIFSINESGRYAIGVVVSIPPISGVVVDFSGRIHASESLAIPIWSTGDVFTESLVSLIHKLMDKVPNKKRFDGIGLAIPGLVEPEKGVSVFFSRLSNFNNTPLKSILQKEFNQKIVISRYLGSAAYSQVIPPIDQRQKSLVYIELGEGIEMALFSDGKPYRGSILNEGGLGHMVIEAEGRTCLCGAKGCLEAYASSRVLIDEAKLRIRNGESSAIPADRDLDDGDFYQFVRKGDGLACEVAGKGMDYLALGIANVVNILNPGKIVISGAIVSAGEDFLEKVKEKILYYALNTLGRELEIVFVPFDLREGAKGVGLLRLYQEQKIFP